MAGEDRDLVLYLDSPTGELRAGRPLEDEQLNDYWSDLLEDEGYERWYDAVDGNGFDIPRDRIRPITDYPEDDVDAALEWEMSDGREMSAEGARRVIEALENLSPETQNLDGPDEDADSYTTRTRGF